MSFSSPLAASDLERLMHALDPSAEHGLHRIGGEGFFHGDDKINVLQVLFQPALNALVQIAHVLEHDRAFALDIEGEHGVSAKLPHCWCRVCGRSPPEADRDGRFLR